MGDGKNFDYIVQDLIGDHGTTAVGDCADTWCQIIPRRSAFGIGGKRCGVRLYLAHIFIGSIRISLFRNPFI